MKREFNTWLASFRESIADYGYYIDFEKVHRNVNGIKLELNILNSLVGSADVESDFDEIITKYPETLKCIPILLAVRTNEIATFQDAGFRLKELIIKEQHNCRATGYWKTNSIKYNFLLIAHEYLFIFEK